LPSSNVRDYLKERFGVNPEGEFYYIGDYWYCRQPEEKYETNGIRAVRDMDIGLKPTTYFLQLIEDEIERNRIDVSREELEALIGGSMIERELDDADCSCGEPAESSSSSKCCGKGYVAVFFEDRCIGCGFYMDELVSSRVPEGRGKELLGALGFAHEI